MIAAGVGRARTWASMAASAVLAVAGASVAAVSAGAQVAATVQVSSNAFAPTSVAVDPGGTVRWVARDPGHAVQSDDGRFRLPATGTLAAGEVAAHTFGDDEEWVRFHCPLHPEMRGAVRVGDPPPAPGETPTEIRRVPQDHPTIADALAGIPAGAAIDLAPGVHRMSAVLEVEGLRLRGTGLLPGEVVLDGGGMIGSGVRARAADLRIENLTLTGFTVAGVDIADADRFVLDRVEIDMTHDGGRGGHGIRVRRSVGGVIRDSEITGASTAAVGVEGCRPCELRVERTRLADSAVGLAFSASRSLTVRSSVVVGNGTGLALTRGGSDGPAGGVDVADSVLRDNVAPVPPRSLTSGDVAAGIGVWTDGVTNVRLRDNDVRGHRYGIAVTGSSGLSQAVRVTDNLVSGSATADLAWDGVGAIVCLSGNATHGGAEPSSVPDHVQTLYPCDTTPPRPGVPLPTVTVDVLLGGRPSAPDAGGSG